MQIKLLLTMASLVAGSIQAQDIAGDWLGTFSAGGAELRLVLHLTKAAGGGLTASLDSVDQGANGIPGGAVTLKDSKVSIAFPAINGKFEGAVNGNATVMDGTWSQGQALPLVLRRTAARKESTAAAASPSDIDGAWLGTLDLGAAKLRLVLHIVNTADGLRATADSPDQGAAGMPVTSITRNGSTLKFEMKQLGAAFEGKIAGDRSQIEGTFSQNGGEMPLVLKPVKDAASAGERRRPQNPVKPYPYREEEVTFDNQAAGIQLAGTLTIPPGKGPFPSVVLITGSGPQDRDETLLGHKPFLVLADHLTRKGIAVLRADDRGQGKSGGDFAKATTADFATDAEAGLAFLKARREIDARRLGLIGHSEGGMIAPMIAARNADVAFIVMMAGPGVRGDEILPAQVAAIAEAGGASHEKAVKQGANEHEILVLLEQGSSEDVIEKKMRELSADKIPEAQVKAQLKQIQSPWFRYFLTYDPALDLKKVKCPVLAINGEKDQQVPPEQNLPAIRKALEAGGNKHFELEKLPGLNHLFQTAKTGSPGEYAGIEETLAPLALNRISGWILKLF